MNVGQLRAAFEGLIDDSVDNTLLLIWLNEAQEDIATIYGPIETTTLTAESGVEYSLPNNFLKVAEVRLDGQEYVDYEISEWGQIAFMTGGDFTVYYHKVPDMLAPNDDNATPQLHEILHSIMSTYAAAKFYDRESLGDPEESAMASKLMGQYEYILARRVKTLKARKRKSYNFYNG